MTFQLGSKDFTRCVIVGSYAINKTNIVNEWVDGNHVTHRNVVRSKAAGTVDLHLRSTTFLNDFRSVLENERNTDGTISVTATLNNTGTVNTFNAFIDAVPVEDFIGTRQTLADFTVTVEEA